MWSVNVVRKRRRPRAEQGLGYKLAFTRYCSTSRLVHESTILLLPPPTCIACTIAILVHGYCAIYDAPPPHPCVCHTPYDIGNSSIEQGLRYNVGLTRILFSPIYSNCKQRNRSHRVKGVNPKPHKHTTRTTQRTTCQPRTTPQQHNTRRRKCG